MFLLLYIKGSSRPMWQMEIIKCIKCNAFICTQRVCQSYCAFWRLSDKGVVFGAPLTEEGIAQIYQLIEYLSKSEYHFMYICQKENL